MFSRFISKVRKDVFSFFYLLCLAFTQRQFSRITKGSVDMYDPIRHGTMEIVILFYFGTKEVTT